jgi:hypothetical protein
VLPWCVLGQAALIEGGRKEESCEKSEEAGGGEQQQAGRRRRCYTSRLTLQRLKIRVVVDGLPLGTSFDPWIALPRRCGRVADDVTFGACFLVYLAGVQLACADDQLQNGTYMQVGRSELQLEM